MSKRLASERVRVIAGLLDGPRARGAFLLRSTMDPPWSLRIQDEAPLTLVAVVRSHACVTGDTARVADTGRVGDSQGSRETVRLRDGDVAIVRGPAPYTVADDPATAPQMVIHPGQRCTTPDGDELTQMADLGIRT